MMIKLVILTLLVAAKAKAQKQKHIYTVFQWNVLDYDFPTRQDRENAIASGNLVPNTGIPIDVTPHYNNRGKLTVFTTIPRFQAGIPYTLAKVSRGEDNRSSTLQPYPSYAWHNNQGNNCDVITSAFRAAINECNQMWVIDSGVIESHQYCPPQLLLFDLSTNELIHRYRFNSSLYAPSASLFITPIAVVNDPPPQGRCQRTKVYVADVTQHGIVVYDLGRNTARRVENKFMYPDPDYGTHIIAGESFTLMDGILGINSYKDNLYFHPMASISEYTVPLDVLNNPDNNTEVLTRQFKKLGNRPSECGAEAFDSRGNLYCVTFNPIKLFKWNVNTPYQQEFFREISVNREVLEFVSGMKVVRNNGGKEELWMMSNRFQKLAAGTQSRNEVNYRILTLQIDDPAIHFHPYGSSQPDLHNKLIFN